MPNLPNVKEDADRATSSPDKRPAGPSVINDDYWKKGSNVRRVDWWDTDNVGYDSLGPLAIFTQTHAQAYEAGKLSKDDRKTYENALLRLEHEQQRQAIWAEKARRERAERLAAERQGAYQAAQQQVNQVMHPYLPPVTIGNRWRDPTRMESAIEGLHPDQLLAAASRALGLPSQVMNESRPR